MAKLSLFDRRRQRVRTTLRKRAAGVPTYSVPEAAALLSISQEHLYRLVRADAFPAVRMRLGADQGRYVVPALAVSRDGVRLGRGGGYYDRALAHARPGAVLVAVVFDDELLDEVPAEAHDHRVTAVVTPSGGWEIIGTPHLPRRTESP